MKCLELEAELRRGLAPVYCVIGEESYLRDRALTLIRRAVQGPGGPDMPASPGTQTAGLEDFNTVVLYGDETDGSEILASVNEVPVFAERRLVVLKNADKVPARDGERLIAYLKEPCETTTVVCVSQKLDGRLKFTQALKEHAVVIDCSPLPEQQLESWIRAEANRLNLRLDDSAVVLLKELADQSLSIIRQELEKLAVYVPAGTVAKSEHVEIIRGAFPGASVFDLTDAIVARNRGRALRILDRNLEAGEAPLRIFGSLVWQYRRLWKAKDLLQQGRSRDLARALGIPPYRLSGFVAQVRRFPTAHLRRAFDLFVEMDSDLKGGRAGVGTRLLESLMIELCANLEATARANDQRAGGSSPAPSRGDTAMRAVRTVRSGQPPGP